MKKLVNNTGDPFLSASGELICWHERPESQGLVRVGFVDEILTNLGHMGWPTNPDEWPDDALRGVVYKLKDRPRFISGYCEIDADGESWPKSAELCVTYVGSDLVYKETGSIIRAAILADSIAEHESKRIRARREHSMSLLRQQRADDFFRAARAAPGLAR